MATKEKAIASGGSKSTAGRKSFASLVPRELFQASSYKRNQGRTVRLVTWVTLGVIVALSAWRLHETLRTSIVQSRSESVASFGLVVPVDAETQVKMQVKSVLGDFGTVETETRSELADETGEQLSELGYVLKLKSGAETDVLAGQLEQLGEVEGWDVKSRSVASPVRASIPWAVPGILLFLGWWFSYRVVNVPKFADFLIAVEAEMTKVSWPTRTELIRSSLVVIFFIVTLAAILFMFDLFWRTVFQFLGII